MMIEFIFNSNMNRKEGQAARCVRMDAWLRDKVVVSSISIPVLFLDNLIQMPHNSNLGI